MKVVILAGGLGTRLSEETGIRPKPMVEIGGIPIICHIMKIYSYYGYNDFIICLGYKGEMIKDYFLNYHSISSDFTVDLKNNNLEIHKNKSEDWKVTLIDTGKNSMTGSRISKIKKYTNNESFMLAYGDCVSDVNIKELLKFHKKYNKTLTITASQPKARWGALNISDGQVKSFKEKPKGDGKWINGGFMVCDNRVFQYISDDDNCIFEQGPMDQIANDGEMSAYQHYGFWHPMDNLKDKSDLNNLWDSGMAPWKK